MKPYVVPREMTGSDIAAVVAAFGAGAARARGAGFDGVEVHAANGYIIDQFLQSATNRRGDRYGGSLDNRVRLLREVLDAVLSEMPAGRVGIRISPTSERKGMGDEDPGALAERVAEIAGERGLAYVHLIEPIAPGFMDKPANPVIDRVRAAFAGAIIQNGSFDGPTADACIAAGEADAVSFGRPYIANPDLVRRLRDGLPLVAPNFDFAYVGEERGYSDYPEYGA
jgi:2,4-dienoyl-CoA reductase-like NADH-dependent reductase (Old Yellow Enzyme family)